MDRMPSTLEKARKEPDSTKARILAAARRAFGQYGFHGATTRIIAREADADISTLHYHWGDKSDLYQAVIFDMTEDLRGQLYRVEKKIHGRPLAERMDIALDMMTDYLFDHPEISNLILLRYFSKTRAEMTWDHSVPEFAGNIARSMGLQDADGSVSAQAKMRVLAMMNAIHNFVSGREFFSSMLEQDDERYRAQAKETLKFIMIPAFTAAEKAGGRDKRKTASPAGGRGK